MTIHQDSSAPPTLLPFDVVGTVNDAVELTRHLQGLTQPFKPDLPHLVVVRYSTSTVAELQQRLATSHKDVQFALFDPDLKVRVTMSEDGKVKLEWIPELAILKEYQGVQWSSKIDFEADCVAWEIPSWNERGVALLLFSNVDYFAAQMSTDGWTEHIQGSDLSWRLARQHAQRLMLRLNHGEPQFLDVEPFQMDDLNIFWEAFVAAYHAFDLQRPELPAWLSERAAEPPISVRDCLKLCRDLLSACRNFHCLRDAKTGYATNDVAFVESGSPILLPDCTMVGAPSEHLFTARYENLPPACEFVECDPTPDEARHSRPEDVLRAKCKNCGFAFSSGVVSWSDLSNIYRKCGDDASLVRADRRKCRLAVDVDNGSACLDDSTPYPLQENAARYLRAILNAQGNWVSGPELGRLDPLLMELRVHRLLLPDAIKALIEKRPGKGSRLLPEAWHS